jgi:hypothetical protein
MLSALCCAGSVMQQQQQVDGNLYSRICTWRLKHMYVSILKKLLNLKKPRVAVILAAPRNLREPRINEELVHGQLDEETYKRIQFNSIRTLAWCPPAASCSVGKKLLCHLEQPQTCTNRHHYKNHLPCSSVLCIQFPCS